MRFRAEPSMNRAVRRGRMLCIGIVGAAALGCHEDGVAPMGPTLVRLSIASRLAGVLTRADRPTVHVVVRYLTGGDGNIAPVPAVLGTTTVEVDGAPGVVTLPVEFDLRPCLSDPGRSFTGDGCPVIVSLSLRLGTLTVDSAQVGPITVAAGAAVTVPQPVELRSVSRLAITWPGQTTPDSTILRTGDSLRVTATPEDAAGAPLSARALVWSSAAPMIASVNTSTGLVTAVAPGTAVISAAGGGRVATFMVRVRAPAAALDSLSVNPMNSTLVLGQAQQLTPTANTAGPGVSVTYSWGTGNVAVASVSSTGVVTGVGLGIVTIGVTATGSGAGFSTSIKNAIAVITVVQPPQAQALYLTDSTGLPVDITNVRGITRWGIALSSNGASVDSVRLQSQLDGSSVWQDHAIERFVPAINGAATTELAADTRTICPQGLTSFRVRMWARRENTGITFNFPLLAIRINNIGC